MKIVCDIDNTLLYTEFKNNTYIVNSANKELIKKINKAYKQGHLIVLWTGRHWNHLEITLNQLKENKIKYHSLLMGKPPADIYIDDLSIKPEEF